MVDHHPQFHLSGSVCITKNQCIFKSVSKAQKFRKTTPKASKKRQQSISKFIKNHENQFSQYLPCENLDLEVPSVELSIQKLVEKNTWEQTRNKRTGASWTQKANTHKSRNHPKIKENPANYHLESILLLPWSPRVVPRCQHGPSPGCSPVVKMVSQNVKMEAPSPPNGNHEKPEGAGGRGRSP